MRWVVRIFGVILGLFLIALVVVLVVGVVLVRRSHPKTDGEITVEGLQETVNIYRDEMGVPHIFAANAADMFFAQGYVHAQDRFWQMEFWRHQGQGRLSEMLGEETVEIDRFLRNVGFNRAAENHIAHYRENFPEYMEILEAYTDGVNAYIEENRDKLSFNMTLLNLVQGPWEIEPWEPIDSVSWGVAMAWDLKGSGGIFSEQDMVLLYSELGEDVTRELLPFYPYDKRPVIAPSEYLVNDFAQNGNEPAFEFQTGAVDWSKINVDFIGQPPPWQSSAADIGNIGSNSWVIRGEKTDTGLPYLADDPHLGIQLPSIWYEVGLHSPGWDVTGFSFAGVPGVVIGHNDRIAWGFTNVGGDVQDLYIEKINPSNPLQYEFEGEWLDMEVIEEVIKIKGAEDEILEVRQTHHGPILNEVADGFEDVLALKWTAYEPSHTFLSLIQLNQAQNYEEFYEAVRLFDVPSQNVIYADVEGNIAYQTPGLFPVRPSADGLSPVPGWTGEHEWEGWIPYEELPSLLNPEPGYIVTANNSVNDEDYPHQISLYFADGDRSQRIVDRLEKTLDQGSTFSIEDIAEIQFDSYSVLAETYVPLLTGLSSADPDVQAAIERMRGWDYQETRDSVPAALFEIFFMELSEATLADEVGAADEFFPWNSNPQRVFFHDLADKPEARWWDNIHTSQVETREDILLLAVQEAVDYLTEHLGEDFNDWKWGNLHTTIFETPVLGQSGIAPIEALLNRGPYASDGGSSIINALSWSWDDPAVVGALPSMRMIVDLSNLEGSKTVHTTGQSGHVGHRNYDDMIDLWLNGEYHTMLFGRNAVESAAVDHLVLEPG